MSVEDDEAWDPVTKIPPELRAWGTRATLNGLIKDETLWRSRVGDDAYERSVEYWRHQADRWAQG